MIREQRVGSYCRRCQSLIPTQRQACSCMDHLRESETKPHRDRYWVPAYVKFTVSMESANK